MKRLGVTLVLVDEAPTEQQTAALEAQGIQILAISPAKSRDDCKRLYREVGSAMVGGNTGYTKGEKACDNVFYTLGRYYTVGTINRNAVYCLLSV